MSKMAILIVRDILITPRDYTKMIQALYQVSNVMLTSQMGGLNVEVAFNFAPPRVPFMNYQR